MRRLHKREKLKRQKSDKLDLHVSLPRLLHHSDTF